MCTDLDEIAYDRVTIMRTKAVLGDTKLIDHHCDIGDMGGNSCAANYMEMYPFIDTLWYVRLSLSLCLCVYLSLCP